MNIHTLIDKRDQLNARIAPLEAELRAINAKIAAAQRPWDVADVRGQCCEQALAAGRMQSTGIDGIVACPTCGKEYRQ